MNINNTAALHFFPQNYVIFLIISLISDNILRILGFIKVVVFPLLTEPPVAHCCRISTMGCLLHHNAVYASSQNFLHKFPGVSVRNCLPHNSVKLQLKLVFYLPIIHNFKRVNERTVCLINII